MKKLIYIIFICIIFNTYLFSQNTNYVIVIHGGAGNISRDNISSNNEKKYRQKLQEAIDVGSEILESGGTSLDAVEAIIVILENSPLFNAGKGAVFNNNGEYELDASIMDGNTMNAGAVAAATNVKNPIKAARKVMEETEHVLLSGSGITVFAKEQNLEIVENTYFATPQRVKQYEKYQKKQKNNIKGTVGCVVLDTYGNLAAGTSTGGMMYKKYGRVGDSPIIGAGTYANNNTCAVSCTGHGEFFIKYVVAYDVSALMEYKEWTLEKSANYIINDKLVKIKAAGGLIAVDKNGNIAMPFNTKSMFRAYKKADGTSKVMIFGDEK